MVRYVNLSFIDSFGFPIGSITVSLFELSYTFTVFGGNVGTLLITPQLQGALIHRQFCDNFLDISADIKPFQSSVFNGALLDFIEPLQLSVFNGAFINYFLLLNKQGI